MHRAMAGETGGRIRIAGGGGLSMNALPEFFHLVGVTLYALGRRDLRRQCHFVMTAVAGLASRVAKGGMHAGGYMGRLIGVADGALDLHRLRRVGIVLDGGVTIRTA